MGKKKTSSKLLVKSPILHDQHLYGVGDEIDGDILSEDQAGQLVLAGVLAVAAEDASADDSADGGESAPVAEPEAEPEAGPAEAEAEEPEAEA